MRSCIHLISIVIILLFGKYSVFAQCGADGNLPCQKTSLEKKQPKFNPHAPQIEMVKIPAGSFMMGSPKFGSDEEPVHRVKIGYDFYLGKYEVTQAQWESVMGNNPSGFSSCGGNCPVEKVSWNKVKEFIGKLNSLSGEYEYRLPSEAEWEYAARGGTTGEYYGELDSIAWFDQNSDKKTHPVGEKQANSFGLFDMSGNVLEWCEDIYNESYLNLPADGSVNTTIGDRKFRVLRGGSWVLNALELRSAVRSGGGLGVRLDVIGFRLAARLK